MGATTAFDIDRLFEGTLRRLRAEAEYFSRLTEHDPELGRLNETHLVRLLRDYLPPKFGVGTGFIASGGDRPLQSQQCDIILYDTINNAPLYKSDAWSIYPIEMVYGVIEVKTTLNRDGLKDAFKKCAKIRAMAQTPEGKGNKAYIRQVPSPPRESTRHERYVSKLPPRFFVFGYKGWKTTAALERNFRAVTDEIGGAHIHGVCNLYDRGSLYIYHRAFPKGGERYSKVAENGFRLFLMNLPSTLDSMLPILTKPSENDTRVGLLRCFDQIDPEHYGLPGE